MKNQTRIFLALLLALCDPRRVPAADTALKISTTQSHHLDHCHTILSALAADGFSTARPFRAAEAPSHRSPRFVDATMLVVFRVTAGKQNLLSAPNLKPIFTMAEAHGVRSVEQKIFRREEKGKSVAYIPLVGKHSDLSDVYYRLLGERPFSKDFKVTAKVIDGMATENLDELLAAKETSEAESLNITLADASGATLDLTRIRRFADVLSALPDGRGPLVAKQFIFHPTAILEIMYLENQYAIRVAKKLAEIANGVGGDIPNTSITNIDGQKYLTANVDQHILIMTKIGRKIVVLGFMSYLTAGRSERTLAARIPVRSRSAPTP